MSNNNQPPAPAPSRPTLEDVCPKNGTCDLNTLHHYLPTYETLYSPIRDEPLTILLIGAGMSGVVWMMNDYFSNAVIHVCDGREDHHFKRPLYHSGEFPTVLHSSARPFDADYVESEFVENGLLFDIIVEDTSPRTLEIMSKTLDLYCKLLSPNGMLIIEDLQEIYWQDTLIQHVPEGRLRENTTVYDLRASGRYDDILFVVKN